MPEIKYMFKFRLYGELCAKAVSTNTNEIREFERIITREIYYTNETKHLLEKDSVRCDTKYGEIFIGNNPRSYGVWECSEPVLVETIGGKERFFQLKEITY